MRLTDEQRMLRDVARDFARTRLAPHAAERDRDARFPAEAVAELGRLGFMGMLVPEEYDGAGADHVGYALVMEEIAAGEGAVSTILSVQNSSAAFRSCNMAPRSRDGGFSCRWRRARCSPVFA